MLPLEADNRYKRFSENYSPLIPDWKVNGLRARDGIFPRIVVFFSSSFLGHLGRPLRFLTLFSFLPPSRTLLILAKILQFRYYVYPLSWS